MLPPTEAALWQAVYDAPDDDAPRAVLADVLQQRGDPRGELIALQLSEHAGLASDAAVGRAASLVGKWGLSWLGRIGAVVRYATFERGFPTSVYLVNESRSRSWSELLDDPALATIEAIETPHQPSLLARVLASAASRNLRAVTIDTAAGWTAFAANPLPRLERLTCTTWTQRSGYSMTAEYTAGFVDQVLPFIEASPRITTLGCEIEMVPRLSTELRARLRGLACEANLAQAMRSWSELPALRSLVASRVFPGYAVTALEFVRGDDRELVRIRKPDVSYGVTHQQAAEILLGLPAQFRTLEVIGNRPLANWLASRHAQRFEIIARAGPSGAVVGVQ